MPDPAAAKHQIEQLIRLGRRFTTKEELADMVVFLASGRSSHTTGQIIYVDGGYTHFDRNYTGMQPGAEPEFLVRGAENSVCTQCSDDPAGERRAVVAASRPQQ